MRQPIFFSMVAGESMYRRFFIDARRANRDVLTRIKYLHIDEMFRETHFVCHTKKDRIVGDLAIQQSPTEMEVTWLKHVSVDPSYRNLGIAKRLISNCIFHVRGENKVLEVSRYSEDGTRFLKPHFENVGAESQPAVHLPPTGEVERDALPKGPRSPRWFLRTYTIPRRRGVLRSGNIYNYHQHLGHEEDTN
jgi:GNAT superfamily N-acetyltransferase